MTQHETPAAQPITSSEEVLAQLENDLKAIADLDASFDRAPVADAHVLALRAMEKLQLIRAALQASRRKARLEGLEIAAEHLPKHVENPDYPKTDKLIQGWSVCACGQAKADGARPYKEIWLEHLRALAEQGQ